MRKKIRLSSTPCGLKVNTMIPSAYINCSHDEALLVFVIRSIVLHAALNVVGALFLLDFLGEVFSHILF